MEFLVVLLATLLIIVYTLSCIVITTAIHELCHFACFKILGGKPQGLEIKLFGIVYDENGKWNLGGYVLARNGWKFPTSVKKFPKTATFLIGLSGGWGAAIILSLVFFGLYLLTPLWPIFGISLIVLAVINFLYGIKEAISTSRYPEIIINNN